MLQRLAVLCLCAAVAGCGWHLRGTGSGSAVGYNVFVRASGADTVARAVRTALVNRGGKLAGTLSASDVMIEIIGQRYHRRILSVDPDSGKVREIELTLTTDFLIRAADGALLVPRETMNWELDYVFDEGSVLGTREQDAIVQNDLAKIAATAIVLRLQTVQLAAVESPEPHAAQR